MSFLLPSSNSVVCTPCPLWLSQTLCCQTSSHGTLLEPRDQAASAPLLEGARLGQHAPGLQVVTGWGRNSARSRWSHVPGGQLGGGPRPCAQTTAELNVIVERSLASGITWLPLRFVPCLITWEGCQAKSASHSPGAWRAQGWWLTCGSSSPPPPAKATGSE